MVGFFKTLYYISTIYELLSLILVGVTEPLPFCVQRVGRCDRLATIKTHKGNVFKTISI